MDATAEWQAGPWPNSSVFFTESQQREAQETVDALVERKIGLVWEVEEIKRVLDPNMNKVDQTLVLLYSKPAWVAEQDLFNWIEYSNANMFRKNILRMLHKNRLIEYDAQQHRARIFLGVGGDEVIHVLLDVMYAKAPYTVIQRAMHIHPTVAEYLPIILAKLGPFA
jgi:hypothetical protein